MRRGLRAMVLGVLSVGCAASHEPLGSEDAALATYTNNVAWSKKPPGLEPVDVPQFVAVTFDDNFVSGLGDATGAMTWATTFFKPLQNPAGSGFLPTFDGAPVRTSFFDNCLYLQDAGTKKSWVTARQAGHEIANHTVNHPHGGTFAAQNWTDEIAPCTAALANPDDGVGVSVDDVRGFRAPYLEYSSELFGTLKALGLVYDTSIQSCWSPNDDGKSCAWPYTLDQGSPDGTQLSAKFATPIVPATAGLWEATPTVLFVPPDELAAQYGFDTGLRQRIPTDMPAPSFYEAATGRIAPLDITLFVDAGLSATEVLATLKYTLDLRLQGNRAPFIFISHSHVYASNYGAAPKAPDVSARQHVLEDFIHYALTKSVVRMRPVADIVTWMQHPTPLNGVVTALPAAGGTATGGASGASGVAAAGGGADGMSAGSGGTTTLAGASGSTTLAPANVAAPSTDVACTCDVVGAATTSPERASLLSLAFVLAALALRRKMNILSSSCAS